MTEQVSLKENVSYEILWHSLHRNKLSRSEDRLNLEDLSNFPLDYVETLNYFQENNNTKIIVLKKITNEEKDYLESLNITFKFLMKNFIKRIDKVTHDTREYQDRAIQDKYVYAVCPITGDILKSNQSVAVKRTVIFYRFVGAEIFYLVTGNLGAGFAKDMIYFPNHDLVFKYEKHSYGALKEHLAILKTAAISDHQSFFNYFYNEGTEKKLTVMIGHPNFAHHLWNELSGFERLRKKVGLHHIDRFLVFREPLGKINYFFPEIAPEKIRYVNINPSFFNTPSIDIHSIKAIQESIKKQYFLVNIGDTYIKHSLTNRFFNISLKEVNSDTKNTINQAKKKCFPLLWISVRSNDRTWNNQTDGLIQIINCLFQDYPKLGIIFDGFSIPVDYLASELECSLSPSEFKMIQENKELIEQIVSQLDSRIDIYNIVGCSLFEANLWAHAIDLYLCHYGTLQHKVGWFALKPGVVHANAKLASSNSARSRSYSVREFGIPPQYIDAAHIKDLPTSSSKLIDLRSDISNYEIDWRVIYQELLQLIEAIQKSKTLPGRVMGYFTRTKRYLENKLPKFSRFKERLKR